jgi:hypothetical protein
MRNSSGATPDAGTGADIDEADTSRVQAEKQRHRSLKIISAAPGENGIVA